MPIQLPACDVHRGFEMQTSYNRSVHACIGVYAYLIAKAHLLDGHGGVLVLIAAHMQAHLIRVLMHFESFLQGGKEPSIVHLYMCFCMVRAS